MDDEASEVKSIDLCKQTKDKVVNETENNTLVRCAAQINSNVTLASITTYNNALFNAEDNDKSTLWKLLHHE